MIWLLFAHIPHHHLVVKKKCCTLYVIELTNSEKEYVVKNFDHLETLKFSHATVKGFTEQGLYMLATILKLATENAQAYLWCEPGNPQILFGNNMILN